MREPPFTPPPERASPASLPRRDFLAVDRTRLANERTLLAYIRTALAFLIAGATALHFLVERWARIAGWSALSLGVLFLFLGGWSFLRFNRRIRQAIRREQLPGE